MFGDIFDQFKGKVREAFDFLMKRKSGDLLGVFHRAEIGDIDLVWGSHERHEGLEHIWDKHKDVFGSIEQMSRRIADIIRDGNVEYNSDEDYYVINRDEYEVVIRRNWRDKNSGEVTNKNWIITAYERTKAKKEEVGTRADSADNHAGETRPATSDSKVSEKLGDSQISVKENAPMPFDAEGEPDWGKVTPERAHAFIFNESGYTREEGKAFVKAWLDNAKKELNKAKNAPMHKIGKLHRQNEEAKARRQARIDAAKAAVDYWQAVENAQAAVEFAELEARRAAAQAEHDAAVSRGEAEAEARKQKEAERKAVGNENPMPAITEKWNNATKVDGHRDEIMLPDGTPLKGHYVLHESGASSPSHNPETWEKTEGFPMDANDNSVNDRDYERDKDAQRVTEEMARAYDQRALQTPVVVSQDGVVLSGNGRTMAGELAARDNTDGAYVDYLKEYAHKYGFTPEQVEAMQHPRVSFVPDERMPYTAATFAKFNQQEMKSQSKTEQAVKLGKTVGDDLFRRIVNTINGYDTLGEFYGDAKESLGVIYTLHAAGVIPQAQLAEMVDGARGNEKLSTLGKEFLENMLIGKAFGNNPDAVRMLTAIPSMRQSVITALGALVDNAALGEDWSLQETMAGAVKLVYEARNDGYGHGDIVSVYAGQGMFTEEGELRTVADFNNASMLMLADVLNDKAVTKLKTTLILYNDRAREAAAGQMDLFSGDVLTREQILKEVIEYINNENKERIKEALKGAGERRKAASVQQDGTSDEVGEGSGNAERSGGSKVDEETGNVMLHEPTATYETRDGGKVVCRSLFDEMGLGDDAEVAMVSQQTGQGSDASSAFAPSDIRLRKLKKGETCHVERVYEETKQFDFTGKEKVESAEDVAYIFRQLENAAVENSFLVLVKDGKPTVIHLGVGSYVGVMAPYEQALVAYRELKPEQVYFVHNHPSGVLKASHQDQDMLNRIKRAFGEDVVQQGIIIDTTSGNYGEFESIETADETYSVEEAMPQSEGADVPVKVYQFSRQVFAPDWNPESAFKIVSSQSVAEFVSSHRLGEHKKMSFLVVNNNGNVVANVFLPWTKLSDIKRSKDASDLLAGYVHQCGGVRGVLYGNYDYEADDRAILAAVGGRMRQLNAPLTDALHVEHSAYENGWAGVGEPEALPEEGKLSITEDAEKEREEIARRAKADGTWMKAPDGTPTRLDERQWAEVRTAPFKDWFGDWETAKQREYLTNGAPVINLVAEKIISRQGQTFVDAVEEMFAKQGGSANSQFGKVLLDRKGVKNDVKHGMGNIKNIAFAAVKDVLENGIIILPLDNYNTNGKKQKTGIIAAPITIDKERYVCAVEVIANVKDNRLYVHEAFATKKLQENVATNQVRDGKTASPHSLGDIAKLLKEIVTVKESSKIVGENGEPLVVYHGTNGTETVRRWNEDRHDYDTEHSRFTVFRRRVDGLRNYGAFFNSSEDNAGGYGNEVYAVYLNMRNPLVIDCRGRSYSDIEYDGEVKDTYDRADYAERMGYDGVVFKNVRDGVDYGGMMTETDDYVVFRPNQIKSATENVGTFDRENPDIRFSLIGEVGAASLDKTRKDRSLIDDLTVAKRMEEAGKSSRDIWTATGWERGADGKWRYEIASAYDIDVTGNAQWVRDHEGAARMKELRRKHNGELLGIDKVTDAERAEYDELKKKFGDVNFAQRIGNPDRAFVGDFLNDTELLEAWPELRKVTVIPEEMKGMDGYYRASDNTIRIEKGIWDKRLINQTNFKRVFVHEVQHKIQELEGFAQGGNSSWAAGKILELTRHWEITEFVNEMRETAEEHPEMGVDELAEAVMREDTLEYSLTSLDIAAAKRIYKGMTGDNLIEGAEYRRDHDTVQWMMERMGIGVRRMSGDEVYRRLMGEVESRNVEARMEPWNRKRPMSETEDVPRYQQIETYDGAISAMGSRVDKRMAEIGDYYKDKELTAEQRAVVDVFSGKADKLPIDIKRADGENVRVVMRQGYESGRGAKYAIYRHFDKNSGTFSTEDILLIPHIIETGEKNVNGKDVTYIKEFGEKRFKIYLTQKNGEELFNDFYSNWKIEKKKTPIVGGKGTESDTSISSRDSYDAHNLNVESFGGKVTKNNSNTQENEGSFSITAEDAGRSRKSAVEAMGGEERWGEWLDAAAARRLGGSRSAGRREETRARLHRLAAGEGYDPAAMADFRQTLVNNVAGGGAATMNVTDADVRLALFEATKNEKGGVSEIAEDARTERRLWEAAAASHDEMEDVLSQELRFSLFGGLHRKQAILDFSYLNYGLNDADIAGLEAVRRAMEETPLADANRHGLIYKAKAALVDEARPMAKFIQDTYGLKSIDEAYTYMAEKNPYLAENRSRSKAQRRAEIFRRDAGAKINAVRLEMRNAIKEAMKAQGEEDAEAKADALMKLYAVAKTAKERQEIKHAEAVKRLGEIERQLAKVRSLHGTIAYDPATEARLKMEREQALKDAGDKDFAGLKAVMKWMGLMPWGAHTSTWTSPIDWKYEASRLIPNFDLMSEKEQREAVSKKLRQMSFQDLEAIMRVNGYMSVDEFIANVENMWTDESGNSRAEELWDVTRAVSAQMLDNQLAAGFIAPEVWQRLRYGDTFEAIAEANGVRLTNRMRGKLRASRDVEDLKDIAGLTDTAIDALKPYYEHYLPLKGTVDISAADILRGKPDKGTKGRNGAPTVMAVSGHENMVRDPLTQLVYDGVTAINNEEQNAWKRLLLGVARDHIATSHDPKVAIVTNPKRSDIGISAFRNIDQARRAAQEQMIAVWENGKCHYMVFADKSIPAILDRATPPKVLQAYNRVARYLATLYTTKNPMFIASNLSRDFQSGLQYNIMKGGKQARLYAQYWVTLKGVVETWKTLGGKDMAGTKMGQYVQEYFDNGGPTAYNQMLSFNDLADEYIKIAKEFDAAERDPNKVMNMTRDFINKTVALLERAGQMSELAARISTYCAARECGKSVELAVWESKEATVNFDKHGKAKYRQYYPIFANFQNAAFQACRREAQLLKHNLWGYGALKLFIATTKLGAQLGLGYALYMMFTDDDEPMSWADYCRESFKTNLHTGASNVMLSWGKGAISIPVPLDDLWLHKFAFLIGKGCFVGYRDGESMGQDLLEVVSQAVDMQGANPIGSFVGSLPVVERDWDLGQRIGWAFGFSNPLISPIAQLYVNTDFTGGAIQGDPNSDWNKGLPRWQLDFNQNSLSNSFAKWLNEATGGDDARPGWFNVSGSDITTCAKAWMGGPLETVQRLGESFNILGHSISGTPMTRYGEETEVGLWDFVSEFPITNRYTKGGFEAYDRQERNYLSKLAKDRANKLETNLNNVHKKLDEEKKEPAMQDKDGTQIYYVNLAESQKEIDTYATPAVALAWSAKGVMGAAITPDDGKHIKLGYEDVKPWVKDYKKEVTAALQVGYDNDPRNKWKETSVKANIILGMAQMWNKVNSRKQKVEGVYRVYWPDDLERDPRNTFYEDVMNINSQYKKAFREENGLETIKERDEAIVNLYNERRKDLGWPEEPNGRAEVAQGRYRWDWPDDSDEDGQPKKRKYRSDEK